ncbi:GIY-YIG nuclease family protein [Aurantivibrio plasticivorans]
MLETRQLPSTRWFIYILETHSGKLYTGITTDVTRRWEEHSSGKRGAKSLRGDKPVKLLMVESSTDRSSASKREAEIKRLRPLQKRLLINTQSPVSLLS